MGTILQPTCKCEFPFKTLLVFGGFLDFTKKCMVPTPCYHCGTILTKNILKPNLRCSKCKKPLSIYGVIVDDSDVTEGIEWNLFNGSRYVLEEMKYKCPVCKEDELTFEEVGNWD